MGPVNTVFGDKENNSLRFSMIVMGASYSLLGVLDAKREVIMSLRFPNVQR